MKTFEELEALVLQWGVDRGIQQNSTAKAQIRKAIEEAAELLVAILAEDRAGIIDGIGDVLVCLIQAKGLLKSKQDLNIDHLSDKYDLSSFESLFIRVSLLINILCCFHESNCKNWLGISSIQIELWHTAFLNGLSLVECLNAAWEKIEDEPKILQQSDEFGKVFWVVEYKGETIKEPLTLEDMKFYNKSTAERVARQLKETSQNSA